MKKKMCASVVALAVFCMAFLHPAAYAAAPAPDFSTKTAALLLVDLNTGAPVLEKNADGKREPASTTKVMTYIIVSENVPDLFGTKVTVKQKVLDVLKGTGSSTAGLKAGDVLSVYDLLNCMMVPSGNDAAEVLADFVGGGSRASFFSMMNAKAKSLGCNSTNFTNPHGLHDDKHYTTARDLALITQYALSRPYFDEITSRTNYAYTPEGGSNAGGLRLLSTSNRLIDASLSDGKYYYPYARGIKTGAHNQSGYTLVSTAQKGQQRYLCVALGAPMIDAKGKYISEHAEMTDTKNCYEWAFSHFS